MSIGLIGAGKVGFSLGKYLVTEGITVSGYYSRNHKSAEEAADFTRTESFESLEMLVQASDVIFLTVPDDAVASVWDQLKQMQITGKVICHCSGVLSSQVFSDIAAAGACGYSVHPLLAVNDRLRSYEEFSNTLFTIEGEDAKESVPAKILQSCGNRVIFLRAEDKIRYHAAAVIASNLVLGLVQTAMEELVGCGFTKDEAKAALVPFMQANVSHLESCELEECLTGPVERADVSTVEKHLEALSGDNREIYRLLSKKAAEIAVRKNPEREYGELLKLLNQGDDSGKDLGDEEYS